MSTTYHTVKRMVIMKRFNFRHSIQHVKTENSRVCSKYDRSLDENDSKTAIECDISFPVIRCTLTV